MRLAILLSALAALLAGCASTPPAVPADLIPLARADRRSLREASEIAVVTYPAPPLMYNGVVDQQAVDIRTQTGVEAPLDRVRQRVVARLTGPLGYAAVSQRAPIPATGDTVEALRAAVAAPLVLDFVTRSWGLDTVRGHGDAALLYTHHSVRGRLVRLSDGQILWQGVCGRRGYPGDEPATLPNLLATQGTLLRQKLTASADRCSDELVELFLGAD